MKKETLNVAMWFSGEGIVTFLAGPALTDRRDDERKDSESENPLGWNKIPGTYVSFA